MKVVITGAAGFIGSTLVDRLLLEGHQVIGLDDLSTGDLRFLADATNSPDFRLVEIDLLRDAAGLADVVSGNDAVVHLAANADVRFGWDAPRRDIEQNILVTANVLDAMRDTGVSRIVFASSGSVYGEATVIPTPEDAPFPVQTSLYAASKLGCEGLIAAYAEGAGFNGTVFRFVSNLGPRYTHGHVLDFMRKLRADPTRLDILGDGTQRKSYIHVADTVAALTSALTADRRFEVFNLGRDDYCSVTESAGWICDRLGVAPTLEFAGGDRGWVGDNPFIFLDASKLRATGWEPTRPIQAAVEDTVDWMLDHPWVLDRER